MEIQPLPAPLERGRVGDRVLKLDGIPKTQGAFAFSGDLFAAGMLHGVTVRSPHPHAWVLGIDPSAALALQGVHAVLTAADVPGEKFYGLEFRHQPVLAIDRVRYFGEPVAIVAADDPETARRAAALVAVDVRADRGRRRRRSAPRRRRRSTTTRRARRTTATTTGPTSSATSACATAIRTATGDVVVEGTYEIGMQDQAFLGTESGIAIPDGEGGIDIYVATQWLHTDREQVAPCLGLPESRVRLHLAGVGGAFGGREDLSIQIHAAMLALHTSRPVKMVYSREESFTGHVHRHPGAAAAGAPRDPRRPAGRGAGRHPHRRRRVRLHVGGRDRQRGAAQLRARTGCRTSRSTARPSTPTTRPAGRCAASAPCRPASRTRRRWTASPRSSASTPSSCG